MSKPKRVKISRIIFVIVVALLIIPKTRLPIQVFLQRGIALILKPSTIEASKRVKLLSYNWKLRDTKGRYFDFSTAEGKVIIINFWATWCPPCIAEMPSLEALYQKYKTNDNVVFLFVSNEERDVLDMFVEQNNYNFEVHQALTAYPKALTVSSIPRTFVINKNGAIVIDKSGAANWASDRVIHLIDDMLKAF